VSESESAPQLHPAVAAAGHRCSLLLGGAACSASRSRRVISSIAAEAGRQARSTYSGGIGGKIFVSGLYDYTDRSASSSIGVGAALGARHFLPGKLRWQTDLKLSSDNLYSDDFPEMQDWKTFRFVESTTNVARSFGQSDGFGAMVGARYADDLQGSTFDDRDEYLLQRLAEVRGDVQPGAFRGPFGIEGRLDSEVIHFTGLLTTESELRGLTPGGVFPRPNRTNGRFYDFGFDGIFDGVDEDGEGDGIFQPGRLPSSAVCLALHPRFARPTRQEPAEFTRRLSHRSPRCPAVRRSGLATARDLKVASHAIS
jgi:hypothetical protein